MDKEKKGYKNALSVFLAIMGFWMSGLFIFYSYKMVVEIIGWFG